MEGQVYYLCARVADGPPLTPSMVRPCLSCGSLVWLDEENNNAAGVICGPCWVADGMMEFELCASEGFRRRCKAAGKTDAEVDQAVADWRTAKALVTLGPAWNGPRGP